MSQLSKKLIASPDPGSSSGSVWPDRTGEELGQGTTAYMRQHCCSQASAIQACACCFQSLPVRSTTSRAADALRKQACRRKAWCWKWSPQSHSCTHQLPLFPSEQQTCTSQPSPLLSPSGPTSRQSTALRHSAGCPTRQALSLRKSLGGRALGALLMSIIMITITAA